MRIRIEMNEWDGKNIQTVGLEIDIYAKDNAQAIKLAHKSIDILGTETKGA